MLGMLFFKNCINKTFRSLAIIVITIFLHKSFIYLLILFHHLIDMLYRLNHLVNSITKRTWKFIHRYICSTFSLIFLFIIGIKDNRSFCRLKFKADAGIIRD